MPNDKSAAPAPRSTLPADEIDRLIDLHFPEIHFGGKTLFIESITHDGCKVRLQSHPRNLRPGGTVSGPAMFALADFAVYVAILARIGDSGLQAVTSNMSLNFLRRPEPGDLVADVALLSFGRRLIVAEVRMFSASTSRLVAIATATYARPASE